MTGHKFETEKVTQLLGRRFEPDPLYATTGAKQKEEMQQQRLQHPQPVLQPGLEEHRASWPLPCAVAPIQPRTPQPKRNEHAALTSKARKRSWTKLQTLTEDRPVSDPGAPRDGQQQDQQRSAIFGLAVPPSAVPAGWKVLKVDATIDSGAEAVVAPPGSIPGALAPSPMSRGGRQYRAANGSRIRNLGQTAAEFRTNEGHSCGLLFQIAEVERVLVGVTPLTEAGHEVRLRQHDGEIVHVAAGKTIALTRSGGVYQMAMYFLVKDGDGKPAASGFARPGQ